MAGGFGPFVPGHRPDNRLHVGNSFDGVPMTVSPIETESRPPVVEDQGHLPGNTEHVE